MRLKIYCLLLVSLLGLSRPALSFESCGLDALPLDASFDFLYFSKNAKETELSKLDLLTIIRGEWRPLLGEHSTADLRLIYQKQHLGEDGFNYTSQSFFYLYFSGLQKFKLSGLDFGIHNSFHLQYQNLKRKPARLSGKDCEYPEILEWESNNPFLSGTKLRYKYFGPMKTKEKSKADHLELFFPDGKRVRFVRKQHHDRFGLDLSSDLFEKRRTYKDRNTDFRKISGVLSLRLSNTCNEIGNPVNYAESLPNCYSEDIKNNPKEDKFKGELIINQRNARWMTRLVIKPPESKSDDFEKESYAGLSEVSYSNAAALWDGIKRDFLNIWVSKTGAPKYVDIDSDRVPSVGGVNGDGNWDPERYSMKVNVSMDRSFAEMEFFEKIDMNPPAEGKRLIRAFYGEGSYEKP